MKLLRYYVLTVCLTAGQALNCSQDQDLDLLQLKYGADYVLSQLPGTYQKPLYTTLGHDSPGSWKDRPFYTKEVKEPGLWQQFEETVRNSSELRERFRASSEDFAKWLTQKRDKWQTAKDVAYMGALAATIPAISYLTLKGGGAAIDIIKHKLTVPKVEIIQKEAGPVYGRWDRVARWWSGYKTPAIIFDPSVKNHSTEINEKTKNIKDHILSGDKSLTYTNLLLYGPPGTGKTMFAKALADYTDMDFIPVTAASLMQDPVAFSKIVEMANRSSYGAIIFIDEADALFLDRNALLKSGAPDALSQYKALNHILAILGQRNNRFMVIAATNFPHVMDEAMNRRFPEKVKMPLPDLETRIALLNLYIESALFNEKYNSKDFCRAARTLLPPALIHQLARNLEGFSPAELASLIESIRNATYKTKERTINKEIISNAIDRAVTTHQEFAKGLIEGAS